MVEPRQNPLRVLRALRNAGAIKVAAAGEKWVAWAEPSPDGCGNGASPSAAMKALVGRLGAAESDHGPNA